MALVDLLTPVETSCVQTALNVLPDSALQSAISGLTLIQSNLQVLSVIITTEILNLDILLAPLVVEKNALLAIQQTVVAQFKILDQAVVQQCVALGSLNQTILASVDNISEAITNTLNLINMKEAVKIQYNNELLLLQDQISFVARMKSIFQTALQVRTQARTVGTLPNLVKTLPPPPRIGF